MFIYHWPKHVTCIEKCPPQVMSPHFGYWQLWCQHNIWLGLSYELDIGHHGKTKWQVNVSLEGHGLTLHDPCPIPLC